VPEKSPFPHSHSHSRSTANVATSTAVRFSTLGLLVLVAAATVFGLIALWPSGDRVAEIAERADFAAPGTVLAHGEVLGLSDHCEAPEERASMPSAGSASDAQPSAEPPVEEGVCLLARVGIRSGEDAGRLVEIQLHGGLAESGLSVGDEVELSGYPLPAQISDSGETERVYTVTGVQRNLPLLILTLIFVLIVVIVGRLRGALALLALAVSAAVLLLFVLPALVSGGPGLLIGMVGASAIMFVTLYFVHGLSMRTTAALVGTLCGILIIAGISFVAVATTRLSGVGDESAGVLSAMVAEIDFRGLLSCSILIAGLGVLNDVTITQASSVWELRAAAPEMSRGEVYRRAMRIGRDHIASTVYTVFFAYAGAAISVLILLYLYDRPLLTLLSTEDIAIEIVRTLCGSIGLVLAVPITTWVATLFIPSGTGELEGGDHDRVLGGFAR